MSKGMEVRKQPCGQSHVLLDYEVSSMGEEEIGLESAGRGENPESRLGF